LFGGRPTQAGDLDPPPSFLSSSPSSSSSLQPFSSPLSTSTSQQPTSSTQPLSSPLYVSTLSSFSAASPICLIVITGPTTANLPIANFLATTIIIIFSSSSSSTTWFLYNVKLVDGCHYVGVTTNPPDRVSRHRAGIAAGWTALHRPDGRYAFKFARLPPDAQPHDEERRQTLRFFLTYGYNKVRGSQWSQCQLEPIQRNEIRDNAANTLDLLPIRLAQAS